MRNRDRETEIMNEVISDMWGAGIVAMMISFCVILLFA